MPKIAEIFPVFSGFFPHFYSFFTNCGEKKLAAIPWHPNRYNDEEAITITDAGWERLKNDPGYEKKLLEFYIDVQALQSLKHRYIMSGI